jgi:metacaspase-1
MGSGASGWHRSPRADRARLGDRGEAQASGPVGSSKKTTKEEKVMNRKAVLVGINDYAPVGAGGPDLRGCVNDVRDMATTLNALGIVPATTATMRIATDARATRESILANFQWLIADAKKGDVLVFYYSGHGSQVADTSGDELDKADDTICPHDYATAGMIRDDDFRKLLTGLPAGVNLEIILDSCHSGTGTRELVALANAPEEAQVAYRYVEPPLDWGFFLDVDPGLARQGLFRANEGAGTTGTREMVVVPGLNHVLWAGCRDYQTSAEAPIGGVWRGVFTYCFCNVLRGAGTGITRSKLDSQVGAAIKKLGYSQVHQLEGFKTALGQKVFT